jgi:DNA-binding beta-propeller fold protein YncE
MPIEIEMTVRSTVRRLALPMALAMLVAAPAARAEQPDAHLYAAASGLGQVDAFAADAGGALGALGALGAPSPAGGRPTGLALSPNGRSLYVADEATGTVSQFEVADSGALTPMEPARVAAGEAPFGVAVAPDGGHVYVTDQAGAVSVFDAGVDGALRLASTAAAGEGAASVALTPDGASAYVANLAVGTVSQYAVAPDGSLTPRTPAAVPAGAAPFAIAVAPDGASAYVSDQSARGSVRQFDVGADGRLAPKVPAALAAGGSPAGLVAGPHGVYVASFADGTLSQFDAAPDGGLSPKAPATVPAAANPWALALGPGGRSLYASNYGAATLSQYDVGDDGALVPKAQPAVAAGARPIALAVRAAPDVTSPTVELRTPADGDTFTQGAAVEADFACDDQGPSGLADCTGTVAAGERIDTSALGEHEFEVVARDGAGNVARVVHAYTVTGETAGGGPEPGWKGWASPVQDAPAVNRVVAGQSVTVGFGLGGDGDPADALAGGSPSSVRVDCDDPGAPSAGNPVDAALVRDGATVSFDWATRRAWRGTCRMLLVELRDGSVHRALFAFGWVRR